MTPKSITVEPCVAMFLDPLTDGVVQIPVMSPWSKRNKMLLAIAHSLDMFVLKVKD